MRIETKEAVCSIYSRVSKSRASAKEARSKATDKQRIMLSGKVKAYTDVLCLLKDRYGRKITLPL